ncbi:MAG: DsbA family protein [Pseudomonadota bacterium]
MRRANWIAGGGVALGAAIAGAATFGASAADNGFNEAQRAEIEALIGQYIEENPDVVFSAVQAAVSKRQAAEEERLKTSVVDNLSKLESVEGGFAAGASAEEARVTVVEFFDYHCGYCKRATGAVMALLDKDPTVRVIFKELPIVTEESREAAKASLAAREQNRYVEFHAAMMRAAGKLTPKRIDRIAEDVGLDVAALRKEMKSPELNAALDRNSELATLVGITGTPTFIVDGEVIPGWNEAKFNELVGAGSDG